MGTVTVGEGFAEDEREHVAALYWEAFGRKLRPGFADETTGQAVVQSALRRQQFLVARHDGQVLGICGFHVDGAGAADFGWSRLRGTLSVPASLRASVILSVLARPDDSRALVLDGICVDAAARGRGIGTRLLEAAREKARGIGVEAVTLSVIDANPRARALYERHGFRPTGGGSLGPLAAVYAFDGYTTMELEVAP